MRTDREIPLVDGEGILVEMANVSLEEVLGVMAQQIWLRVNAFAKMPEADSDEFAPYMDAAKMAYKVAYNSLLPETPEFVEWKKSQQQAQN